MFGIKHTLQLFNFRRTALTFVVAGCAALFGATQESSAQTTPVQTSNVIHTTFTPGAPPITMGGPCRTGSYTWLKIYPKEDWRPGRFGLAPLHRTPTGWTGELKAAEKLAGKIGALVGRGSAAKVAVKIGGIYVGSLSFWWIQFDRKITAVQTEVECVNGVWAITSQTSTDKTQTEWRALSSFPALKTPPSSLGPSITKAAKAFAAANNGPVSYHL